MRRRARALLGNDAEAQDALQEVFVRVIRSMGEFRGQSQPSTWLYRIVTNLCLNRIRDSKRQRARLQEAGLGRSDVQPGGAGAGPDGRIVLQRVLDRIDPELGEIAVYYYVDEMDQAEIASILGLSRRTIGYRLERFLAEARPLLSENEIAALMPVGVPKDGKGAPE